MNEEITLIASSWQRRVLWYTAWILWLPAVVIGISRGNLLLAFVVGLPLFLLFLYFSLTKLVCPQCNYVVRAFGIKMTNCMKCGADYRAANPTRKGHNAATQVESERELDGQNELQ